MHAPPHPPAQGVECHRCANRVLVAKNSPAHTSVQWGPDAAATCGEFTSRVSEGTQCALIPHCTALRDSIDAAVREGTVDVG